LSGSYLLDLSGVGDPAGSNATADLALRVTGTHKPLHHDKLEGLVIYKLPKLGSLGPMWAFAPQKKEENFTL
jgi:hypothetical protein